MSFKAQLEVFHTWQGAYKHYCDKRDFTYEDVPAILPDEGIMFKIRYSPDIYGELKGKRTVVQYTPQENGSYLFMEEIDE